MLKKYGDFIAGLCGAAFAVWLFVNGYQIGLNEGKDFGAGFLPKLVAVGLFICCLILTSRGYRVMRTVQVEESSYKKNYIGAYGIFIMMVLYAVCLKPVGFVISSVVFLFCAILLATKRENWKPVFFAVLSVVLVLAVYFVFKGIFGIRLPNGLLSDLF
ncbi:MAG: tripartite tricarboxylate transporter TctB family protein [Candidatus Heteroscillospira sp.]|jgi:putative tricarboxylic transport membrane protein